MWRVDLVASQVLRQFSTQRRRVVGDWRVLLELDRQSKGLPASQPDPYLIRRAYRKLKATALKPVPFVTGVHLIDVAYAEVLPYSDEQILQEANPLAVFSHATALVHHSLTDQLVRMLHLTEYAAAFELRIPLGTVPEEWHESDPPPAYRPKQVRDVPVRWFRVKAEWDFGHEVGYSQGQPIYVTDVERTLLDALRTPDVIGGPALMLRAWKQAGPSLNVDRLVAHTDRFDQPVLRQRVGYLLGQLGHDHPRLTDWRAHLQRGGSLRLVASEPYSSVYSAEWNLSLNVPSAVLAELH